MKAFLLAVSFAALVPACIGGDDKDQTTTVTGDGGDRITVNSPLPRRNPPSSPRHAPPARTPTHGPPPAPPRRGPRAGARSRAPRPPGGALPSRKCAAASSWCNFTYDGLCSTACTWDSVHGYYTGCGSIGYDGATIMLYGTPD